MHSIVLPCSIGVFRGVWGTGRCPLFCMTQKGHRPVLDNAKFGELILTLLLQIQLLNVMFCEQQNIYLLTTRVDCKCFIHIGARVQVAECLLNPFGGDDDDFEISALVEDQLRVRRVTFCTDVDITARSAAIFQHAIVTGN